MNKVSRSKHLIIFFCLLNGFVMLCIIHYLQANEVEIKLYNALCKI